MNEPVDCCSPLSSDRPGEPGPIVAENIAEDAIGLKWTPPRRDGGNPVKGYIVEKREKGDKKWTK